MKYAVALIAVLFIAGCDSAPQELNADNIGISCLGGVQYYHYAEHDGYRGYGYLAPVYSRSGKIKPC